MLQISQPTLDEIVSMIARVEKKAEVTTKAIIIADSEN